MQVESWNRIGSALGCFLKLWAIAASRNSSCARHGLRCTAVKAAIVFLDSVQDEADRSIACGKPHTCSNVRGDVADDPANRCTDGTRRVDHEQHDCDQADALETHAEEFGIGPGRTAA